MGSMEDNSKPLSFNGQLYKSPAQVALCWGLQMGHSVLPKSTKLPKSTNEARIKENFDVFDWSIPEDLFAKFSEINQGRLVKGTAFVHETLGAYKTFEELWDDWMISLYSIPSVL